MRTPFLQFHTLALSEANYNCLTNTVRQLLFVRWIPLYRRQRGLRNLHNICSFSGRFSTFFASLSGENSEEA